jgi:hypothetical protein
VPDDEQEQESTATENEPMGDDKFGPQAIAARIEKIGAETDVERTAREEEQKLNQRRKGKKSGLEAAASKRLAKIGETAVKRPSAASVDPDVVRAARIGKWVDDHRQSFIGAVGVVVIAVAGLAGWLYWRDKHALDASILLGQAFAAEHGHIAAPKANEDDEATASAKLLYPTFTTVGEQRDAALVKYRSLESKYSGTGAATVSHLAEGSLLLDAGDGAGALAAYEQVASSALAQADAEVRGRALEGKGFADELLANKDPATHDKYIDDAAAAYKALEAVDENGFKELGLYHQARIAAVKGDKAKAVEILKDVVKRISDSSDTHAFAYLQFEAEDTLRDLDPSAAPPKAPKGAAGANGVDMTDPKIQELIKQMQEKAKGGVVPVPTSKP